MARRSANTQTPLFVDTVYWLALMNKNDQWHERALDWSARSTGPLVTTEAVLTEVADALCRADRRRWAIEAIRAVRSDSAITTVAGSASMFLRAFALYSERHDKDWSLTDCISFVVMKERALDSALTADIHFVQAGFRALLRE
jgi:predicted nucleic acid-binding protein